MKNGVNHSSKHIEGDPLSHLTWDPLGGGVCSVTAAGPDCSPDPGEMDRKVRTDTELSG